MSEKELAQLIASKDFYAFCRLAFAQLNPTTPFLANWHLRAMAWQLTRMKEGQCSRLVITVPPRALKSTMVSVAWPAFLLGHNPAERILVTSYSEPLAETLSNHTRQLMTSSFYQAIFPGTRLTKNTRLKLGTDQNGGRFATTIGGPVTGFGANWIIADDPHNASEAYSEAARETVKRYYGSSLRTRLDDPTTGKFIAVMQRLHEDDLAGHLLTQGWDHLCLPAVATEDRTYQLSATGCHRVKAGDLLHARRLPLSLLDEIKRDMGSVAFQAQYQQQPVPEGGNIVKRDWLRYYDTLPARHRGQIVLSLDTATKTREANDYSVCTAWLCIDNCHYLIDVWRDKVEYPQLRQAIAGLYGLHRADRILIEDHGTGTALIQELITMGISAIPFKSRYSKEVRLAATTGVIEAGQLWLPQEAHWLAAFITELLAFPAVKHDDQVDSLSQYLTWHRGAPSSLFSWDMGWGQGPDHDQIAEHLLWLR